MTSRLSGAELAKCDSLSIIRSAASSVDKGRVEPMHIEVLVINEETFSNCGVPVIQCMHIEPRKMGRTE